MALGLTQPLTEMTTRRLRGHKGRPLRKADNFIVICRPIVKKMWDPRRLTTLWTSTACYRDNFTFIFLLKEEIEKKVMIIFSKKRTGHN
jgi:hypothetical protein